MQPRVHGLSVAFCNDIQHICKHRQCALISKALMTSRCGRAVLHCIGCSYLPRILFLFTIFTMLKTAVLCFVDIVPDVVEQQAERSRKDSRWMGPLPLQHDFIYILIILWFLTFAYLWHPKTLVPNKCQVNIAKIHLADLSGSWGTLFVWAGLTKLRTCVVLIQSYLTQVSVCK